MSIADKTGQTSSVTEVWRSLQLFTNRQKLINLFISYLNEEPAQERILFFHGDGGNGKSLLLRYLQEHFCKRFERENWQWLKENFSGDELIEHIKRAGEKLIFSPYSSIDFGLRTTNEDRPQEAFYGLLMLRRQLAAVKIKFPLFDFACVWYLHKTKQLSMERLKNLFPAEEMEFLVEIFNAASGTTIGAIANAIINIFGKHIKGNFALWRQKRGIDETKISWIQQLNAETDLMEYLPDFFAEDLNAAMQQPNAPERIILFFDTHESFWGFQRDMPETTYFRRDEWLRRLLLGLELSHGIVTVIAGRERPHWSRAPKSNIPEEFIDAHLVGHLSRADADSFLQRAGISDAELRTSLTKYTEVEPDEVHPLYLGLSADVVLAAKRQHIKLEAADFPKQTQTELKEKELINRLLSYVEADTRNAVCALAAARAFEPKIFVKLGAELNFNTADASFEMLRSFSFVWRAERRGTGWYRIHDLLRRLFAEHDKEKIEAAHHVLENYYRQLNTDGDELAIAEAIYHANRLDWLRGADEWRILLEHNLQISRYQVCRALLDVRREMIILNDFWLGFISASEGDFYFSLSLHAEAQKEYTEAVIAYDKALRLADEDIIYNNKGNVLQRRGDLEAVLTRYDDALKSYNEAVKAYGKALHLSPDHFAIFNNKGLLLQKRGDLEARLTRVGEALQSYDESVKTFERALGLAPDSVEAHNNRGIALKNRGDLKVGLTEYEDALKSYEESVDAFEVALELDPDVVQAYNNKGLVLRRRGYLETILTQPNKTLKSYQDAVDTFDKALRLAPDDVYTHNNKGLVLKDRGNLEATLMRYDDALRSYDDAVAAYDKVLKLAPDYVYARNNKGIVLQNRAHLRFSLGQTDMACMDWAAAVTEYSSSLKLAPNDKQIQIWREEVVNLIAEHCGEKKS